MWRVSKVATKQTQFVATKSFVAKVRFASSNNLPRTTDLPNVLQQKVKDNNGIIWISNVYLLGRYMNLVRIWYKIRGKEKQFQERLHKEIEDSFDNLQFPSIRQIVPALREGGCYITFATKDQAKQVLHGLNGKVQIAGELKDAYLVQGKPFLEDLSRRKPSKKLSIELVDVAKVQQRLSQELLYNELRIYGRMEDIIVDNKRETASIIFNSINSAISARNCTHLKSIGDSQLYIRYEPYSRFHQAMEFLSNPKILIPLIGIGITLSTYLLVDPIRLTSVTQKITRGYRDEDHIDESSNGLREDLKLQLKKHFRTSPDSVMILTGPSGTGKSHLLKNIMHKRTFTVLVDCREIYSVESFLENFGDAIGFSPSFHTLSNLLGWMESFIPGLKKTALSPSIENQLQSMLTCLDRVLFIVSAGYPSQKEWDYPIVAFDGFHELIEALENTNDKEKARHLVDILINWVVRNSTKAHFVFLGENSFGEEIIKQNRFMKVGRLSSITIPDIDQSECISYLKSHIKNISEEQCEYATTKLGGRVSDLQALITKLHAGQNIKESVDEMVKQAELIVRTEGFGGKILGASSKKWSQLQLWKAMKRIVLLKTPTYDDVLFTAFSGDSEALKALVKCNILSIQIINGVKTVTAFSPLFYTAFEKIVNQSPQLRKGLDLVEKKADINKDMEELVKIEEELIKLKDGESKQDRAAPAVKQRRELLFDKLIYLNTKLEKKEKEARAIENS